MYRVIGNINADSDETVTLDNLSIAVHEVKAYFESDPIDATTDILISDSMCRLDSLRKDINDGELRFVFDIDVELGKHEKVYIFVGNKNDIEEYLPCHIEGLKSEVTYAVEMRVT